MKRWIVYLLVGLAVIVLVSPGIIGRLAESNLDRSLSQADLGNERLSITAESFRRGWFTSEGTYRVSFNDGRLISGLQSGDNGTPGVPALVFETRLDHGLVPIGSLQRDNGSLGPALANAISTVSMDRGDGQLHELPATLYATVSLGGASTVRLVVEAGSDSYGNTSTEWEGADLTYSVAADGLERGLEGTVQPFSVDFWDISTRIGDARIDSRQSLRSHPVGEGFIDLSMASVEVMMAGEDDTVVGPLTIHVENSIARDGAVEGGGRVAFEASQFASLGAVTFDALFSVDGVDADGLKQVMDASEALLETGSDLTPAELQAATAVIDEGAMAMAARGGSIVIESANLSLPQGDASLSLSVELDESSGPVSSSDVAGLILKTSGQMQAVVSETLYEHVLTLNPQLRGLVAAGYLVKTGDGYEVELKLNGGRLVINGAPLNLTGLMNQ